MHGPQIQGPRASSETRKPLAVGCPPQRAVSHLEKAKHDHVTGRGQHSHTREVPSSNPSATWR